MTTNDPADDVGQPFPPDDAQPDEREEIPRESLVGRDDQLPETQDDETLDAELGDQGQGDLAPEDEPGAGTTDAPQDLRTEDG